MDVSGVAEEAHPRACRTRLVGAGAAAKVPVGEEMIGGGVARAEVRRPDNVDDFVRTRVSLLLLLESERWP